MIIYLNTSLAFKNAPEKIKGFQFMALIAAKIIFRELVIMNNNMCNWCQWWKNSFRHFSCECEPIRASEINCQELFQRNYQTLTVILTTDGKFKIIIILHIILFAKFAIYRCLYKIKSLTNKHAQTQK